MAMLNVGFLDGFVDVFLRFWGIEFAFSDARAY